MENSSRNKLLSGLSIQTVITVSTAVLQIVIFSIFSRLLGREEFGYYAAITGVVSILSSISDAGIGSSLIQKKNVTDLYRSTAFSLSLTFGMIAALINLCLSPVISELIADKTIITPLRLLSVSIIMYSLHGYFVSSLRKELKFKTVGICKLMSYTIASGVGIVLAYKNVGLYSLVIMTLLDSVLYMIFLLSKSKLSTLGFSINDAKK
ncbi:MAG: oligosaccharide flippase family protein, partial [Erysipelotrichaceae bacterium]|nr:oligosaccharide flippase family protein [Erysipelotrichaceae bacterium]